MCECVSDLVLHLFVGVLSVMVTILRNGYGEIGSNPGRDCVGKQESNYSLFSLGLFNLVMATSHEE